MSFLARSARPFEQLDVVGIAFLIQNGQNHVGFLVRYHAQIHICHLAWHHALVFQPVPNYYFWDDCHFLADDRASALSLAGYIIAIGTTAHDVPFGITYIDNAFDHHGRFIAVPEGLGLTCATFVMSVLSHLAFQIFDLSTWSWRFSDIWWQWKIIRRLRRDGATDHANTMRRHIGSRRFRPEEVAAAASGPEIPLTFQDARRRGRVVITDVRAAMQG